MRKDNSLAEQPNAFAVTTHPRREVEEYSNLARRMLLHSLVDENSCADRCAAKADSAREIGRSQ
jgi:hypothetical protein